MPLREGRTPDAAAVVPTLPRAKSTVREYAEALGVALLLALVIRTFVVQAFKIPSGSMIPTLEIGDHILVNKFIFGPRFEVPLTQMSLGQLPGLRAPAPGDVIVFIYPKEPDKDYIKRVIAVGGQTVEVRGTQVMVDGVVQPDSHAHYSGRHTDYGPTRVPEGTVFVMGDNRDQSYDSRFWGTVPLANVKGLAMVIYWSWGGENYVRWERLGHLVE
jgi:signal peptidase I